MSDRINKTSICSIVFLDIIDYSKKSDADQIEVKNQFNDLVNRSLKGVAQNDRIILDTGDGVAIAHMGSPEDAMFVALTIRDGILKTNKYSAAPLYVRFGINLGPVRIVTDINGQPNIIGDGINVAQRIMSFAPANQILVSRSYYEVTSRLTAEFSEMFDYSGVKHDKHVREHEVYSVRSHKDAVANASQPMVANEDRRLIQRLVPNLAMPKLATFKKVNLKYAALALPALVIYSLLVKAALDPSAPRATPIQSQIGVVPSAVATYGVKSGETSLPLNETTANETTANETKALKAPSKSAVAAKPVTNSVKTTELIVEKSNAKPKLGWKAFTDSVKQGKQSQCTQAQISINQCR